MVLYSRLHRISFVYKLLTPEMFITKNFDVVTSSILFHLVGYNTQPHIASSQEL